MYRRLPSRQAGHRGQLQFLVIKNPSGRWTFPKGTIEMGETREQTALREVQEETGLTKLEVIAPLGKSRYFFVWPSRKDRKRRLIYKTVHWFLMKGNGVPRHQAEEIDDAKWVNVNEILTLPSYRNSQKLLQRALKKLASLDKMATR